MSFKSIQFVVKRPVAPEYKRFERCWTQFTLGEGPCGLFVHTLECTICGDLICISQYAGNSAKVTEVKTFTYKMSDVLGRITAISA
jgi:hypothetical protein